MSKTGQAHNNKRTHWKRLHQVSFYIATLTFVACAVITIPYFEVQNVISLYQWLLRIYSVFLFLAQIAEFYNFEHINRRQSLILSLLSLVGNFLYFWSSYIYDSFNEGMLYMVASFFLSLSSQLKILVIIAEKGKKVLTSISEDKYQFYLEICSGMASVLFLMSSIISIVVVDEDTTQIVTAVSNIISSLLMLGAAYNLRRKYELTKGYLTLEQMSQVLAIHY